MTNVWLGMTNVFSDNEWNILIKIYNNKIHIFFYSQVSA